MKFHKESKSEKRSVGVGGRGVSKSVLTKNPVLKENKKKKQKKKKQKKKTKTNKKKCGVGVGVGGGGRGVVTEF